MNKSSAVAVAVLACVCLTALAQEPVPAAKVASTDSAVSAVPATTEAPRAVLIGQKNRLSYSFGYKFGWDLKSGQVDVNTDVLIQGIVDALTGAKPLLSEQEVVEMLNAFGKEQTLKLVEKQRQIADKNLKDGEAFLAENAKKEGVVTLPSGLQYKVITEGKGDFPARTDKVAFNYRGMLFDGREFANSYKSGVPQTTPVAKLIPGMREAVLLMKPGAKWQVFIPSRLAHGESGVSGSIIGPNLVLVYEVELVSVEKSDASAVN